MCQNHIFKVPAGVPTMAHGAQRCLCSAGTQVPSQAWHSGLKIWCSHNHSTGHNWDSDLIPSLGTPYTVGLPKKKKKENKHNKNPHIVHFSVSEKFFFYVHKNLHTNMVPLTATHNPTFQNSVSSCDPMLPESP